jgi:ribonuclease D
MSETLIDRQEEFEDLCAELRAAELVAFDTEFVAEHSYQPLLCLMQFATRDRKVAVDPFALDDLSPWWEIMADEQVKIVVHGGQAEIRFCLVEGGLKPANLYDIQIAEAFRSRSYPLSYDNLVQRVLKQRLHGKETRTDWRRRPLLPKQAKYALEDVAYILPIYDDQVKSLTGKGRLKWAEEESQQMVEDIAADLERPGWLKLSGLHRLQPRELAVARELYEWRERQAERRDRPPRTILRDDLILELSRRRPKNASELLATRDMERDRYKRYIDDLVEVVAKALALPKNELPKKIPSKRQDNSQDDQVIGKLLSLALANRCSELNMAMSIIATSSDLREFVRWSLNGRQAEDRPQLIRGWRSEVCGQLLTDVLDGKIAIRVADLKSDHPLIFEREEEG